MSAWFSPDDEVARRLEQTLQQEADAMPIPEKFDEVADAARSSRRRFTLGVVAGVAAGLTIVALAGGYLASQGGLRGTPEPAGAPTTTTRPASSPAASAATTPTPRATPTPPSTPTPEPTREATPDPTTAPVQPDPQRPVPGTITGSQLGFASPTGNLVCTMDSEHGVRCHAMQANWSGKDVPADRLQGCSPEYGEFGPGQDVILTKDGPFGSCVSDMSVFEAVELNEGRRNDFGTEFRTWARQDTQLVEIMPGMKAYVLPYGTTVVTGRFTCTMATTGITCTDTRTKDSFHLSRNNLTLR